MISLTFRSLLGASVFLVHNCVERCTMFQRISHPPDRERDRQTDNQTERQREGDIDTERKRETE